MIEAVWAVAGLVVGAGVAWLYRKTREARLEVQLEEARRSLADQQDAFKAMAGEALRGNNAEFLQLAEQSMKGHLAQAAGDLELRRKAVE